jgi:predicted transcriptional regulator
LKKERTSVLVNQEDLLKLKTLSMKMNKSTSFLIQEAIADFLIKKMPDKKIEMIGMVDSGDPHFAEKDEEILDKIVKTEIMEE